MGAVLTVNAVRMSVWDEHEAIAQAIRDGDADRAARWMLGHGQRASQHLSAHLTAQQTAQQTAATETSGDTP
jgi:DNA-binding FadR family transcriptional regulator